VRLQISQRWNPASAKRWADAYSWRADRFRIVLAQPRAAIAVLIPMSKMPVMRGARSSARELSVKCWWHFVLVTLKISVRE
jgi:hypothetical protein